MVWHYRNEEAGEAWEAFGERGLQIPDDHWSENPPELEETDPFFIRAYQVCASNRQVGMAPGPIPEEVVARYAERKGYPDPDGLYVILCAMDSCVMKWAKEKEKKEKSERMDAEREQPNA